MNPLILEGKLLPPCCCAYCIGSSHLPSGDGRRKYNWNAVDWTQQNVIIAQFLKCSPAVVFSARKRLGKPRPENWHRHTNRWHFKFDVKWETVDWKKQDIIIAAEIGCSREYVRQKRVELKQGKPLFYNRQFRIHWKDLNWSLTDAVLAAKIGCCGATVSKYRKLHGTPPAWRKSGNQKYAWETVDWNDRNPDIAAKLGCTIQAVASYRYAHKKYEGIRCPHCGQQVRKLYLKEFAPSLTA